jgi:sugar fermentation stimulation protein A
MKILEINNTKKGIFIERPNRYLSKISIDGKVELVHVHDPGKLRELLYEGNEVLIRKADNPNRKTKFDLIAAKKDGEYILVNSMYHRYISENFLKRKHKNLRAEVKHGKSRIDFLANDNIWIEIKGCTLSENGVAKFPDAPTKRGLKHLNELMDLKNQGYESHVYFLIFADAECFSPNYETDPEFSETLEKALESGVKIFPLLFSFEKNYVIFKRQIPMLFGR